MFSSDAKTENFSREPLIAHIHIHNFEFKLRDPHDSTYKIRQTTLTAPRLEFMQTILFLGLNSNFNVKTFKACSHYVV